MGRKTQAATSYQLWILRVFFRLVGYILRVNSTWMTWPFSCKIPEAAITQNKILLALSGVVPWAGTACGAWGLWSSCLIMCDRHWGSSDCLVYASLASFLSTAVTSMRVNIILSATLNLFRKREIS